MKRVDLRLESSEFATDHLQLRELHGRERISDLFAFDLTLASLDPEVTDKPSVGAAATLVWSEDGAPVRKVHGIVAECTEQQGGENDQTWYRLRLVPQAHRLSLVQLQEVFIDARVPDILQKKLELVGLPMHFALHAGHGPYPQRSFVVQYKETDLDFIRRLCEHVGIAFFFDHDGGSDRLVFCDDNAGFAPRRERLALPYRGKGEKMDVYRLDVTTRMAPTVFGVSDYNEEMPHIDLTAMLEREHGHGGGIIEYGTHHRTPAEGQHLAKVRSQERGWPTRVFSGESDSPAVTAPRRLTVEGHPKLRDVELLVYEVEHRAAVGVGDAGGFALSYRNSFHAIPAEVPFRPQRTTPRPRIHGLVSGIVRAAPGTSAEQGTPWIDHHGRYVVQMMFESAQTGERVASLPIRMAQSSAGANYGMHFPLRPGTEVVVAFIDGDPDRPVIVGAVHNAIAPNLVNNREPTRNRIRTASGVIIEINDGD